MKQHIKRVLLIAASITAIFEIGSYLYFRSKAIDIPPTLKEIFIVFLVYCVYSFIGYLIFMGIRWVIKDMQTLPKK